MDKQNNGALNLEGAVSVIENLTCVKKNALDALAAKLKLPKGAATEAIVRMQGVRSQSDFSALMIELSNGTISAEELTGALAKSFPGANIGKRHGPHYLCLARTGKLAGTSIKPPKAARKAAAAMTTAEKIEATKAKLAKLEAEAKGNK